MKPSLAEHYGTLGRLMDQLHAEGIEAHSLARAFENVRETLYIDDCCHVNRRGVDLLAEAIAARILASQKLAKFPERRCYCALACSGPGGG